MGDYDTEGAAGEAEETIYDQAAEMLVSLGYSPKAALAYVTLAELNAIDYHATKRSAI